MGWGGENNAVGARVYGFLPSARIGKVLREQRSRCPCLQIHSWLPNRFTKHPDSVSLTTTIFFLKEHEKQKLNDRKRREVRGGGPETGDRYICSGRQCVPFQVSFPKPGTSPEILRGRNAIFVNKTFLNFPILL